MNETIGGGEMNGFRDLDGSRGGRMFCVPGHTTRESFPQLPGQLAIADINGVDLVGAPLCRRQSVNPPVEAPTSMTTQPVTFRPNVSSACCSFTPPRLAKG